MNDGTVESLDKITYKEVFEVLKKGPRSPAHFVDLKDWRRAKSIWDLAHKTEYIEHLALKAALR